MKITETEIFSTSDLYSSYLKFNFDGLNSGNTYLLNLDVESQNPNGGAGFKTNQMKVFNVLYPNLKVLNKPIITQIESKSALQIDWAGICLNPGVISGTFNYVDDFLTFGNTALSLDIGSSLNYSTTIIAHDSTFSFTIKMDKTYNGTIVTSNDGKYLLGYDLTQQKFYTVINNVTTYGDKNIITVNPFNITLLENKAIIRLNNRCNKVSNMLDVKVADILNYPVAYMIQETN